MQKQFARTDLAAEAAARLDEVQEGVRADKFTIHGCAVSRVVIYSDAGAQALGKPVGKYLTLEMADYVTRRGQSFPDCAAALRELLRSFPAVVRSKSFLVACLGNRAVTPDAVGHAAPQSLAAEGFRGLFVRIRPAHRRFGHDRH